MSTATAAPPAAYGRTNPFPSRITVNRRLNPGSEKDTRHLELDLTGSGLTYAVGESLAVHPRNDPRLVDEMLRALGANGDEIVAGPAKANRRCRSAKRSFANTSSRSRRRNSSRQSRNAPAPRRC